MVVVAGSPDGAKAAVVVASGDGDVDAGGTVRQLAALVGGGGGGSPELAMAGGSDVAGLDELRGPGPHPPGPRLTVRVVGIDLGERRIGVAVSDGNGTLASPWGTIERGADPDADRRAIAAAVDEVGARRVVVGLPLGLDGRRGRAARAAQAEADALQALLEERGVGVECFDERLTTVSASRSLTEAGHRGRRQRGRIDQAAAAVLLQAWLDAHRGERGG